MKNRDPLWIFLIRWWSGGAIYFLIGWGTPMGQYDSLIDLVFFLGLGISLANTFLVNPALKMLFNYGWHKSYGSSNYMERVVCRVKDIFIGFTVTLTVMGIYTLINNIALKAMIVPEGEVFLPGEPLLYGLFYSVIITIYSFILNKITSRTNN